MALLEQAFSEHLRLPRPSEPIPQDMMVALPSPFNFQESFTSALKDHASPPLSAFDNPEGWSFAMLLDWMCTIPRSLVDDAEWARRIRTCVMAHSEQICVTLLAALGVPLEGLDFVDPPARPKELMIQSSTPELFVTGTDGVSKPRKRRIPEKALSLEDTDNICAYRVDISLMSFSNWWAPNPIIITDAAALQSISPITEPLSPILRAHGCHSQWIALVDMRWRCR